MYKEHESDRIHLTIYNDDGKILSEHLPYIQDIYGNSSNVIDLYIGERKECDCNNHPWSKKRCDFKFIKIKKINMKNSLKYKNNDFEI